MSMYDEYSQDSKAALEEYNRVYDTQFAKYFSNMRDLYERLKSKSQPITQDELEQILTTVPLELFSASEALNSLRLQSEVIKLKNKEFRDKVKLQARVDVATKKCSSAEQQDYIAGRLAEETTEFAVMTTIYSAVISRVESELSFARELIMGAKKIWDSRRSTENANPISPIDVATSIPTNDADDLPDYHLEF